MKITYDRSIDAVYIALTLIRGGEVVKTYPCDPLEVMGEINLDFDSFGRLIGIEVQNATQLLPNELLRNAEIIG